MKVYYLGPEGSYSYILASQYFSEPTCELVACSSFSDISAAVIRAADSYGLLPIENSTTSNVHENIEHIFGGHLKIQSEAYLAIKLHLLGTADAQFEKLDKVYSHEKALAQCTAFLNKHSLSTESCSSTAEAARIVSTKGLSELGAIGSSALAKEYGLKKLCEHIGDEKQNLTRFVVVRSKLVAPEDDAYDKVSLTFSAHHKPGALAAILGEISEAGGNLTYIQSKPIPGQDFHYNFWIDIEAAHSKLQSILTRIEACTLDYSVVGYYSHGKIFES